jgi:hypothetical protein
MALPGGISSKEIGGPISIGLPFGIMWAYHSIHLNKQIAFDENLPRRAGRSACILYSLIDRLASAFLERLCFFHIIDLITGTSYLSDSGSSSTISAALFSDCWPAGLVDYMAPHANGGAQ